MISYFDPEKAKDCDWISAKAWVRMVDRAIRMAGRNKGNLLQGIVNCLGVAQPVAYVFQTDLDNIISNNYSLSQLKNKQTNK